MGEAVPETQTPEAAPILSVVLPVLDEAADLGRLLLEIRGQQPPPGGFEVIVVDGGSRDATRAIVTEAAALWPALRLLDNPRRLSSAARNFGARAARGRYVLYLDGHCALPRSDYLVRTVALFEATGAPCLCRPQPLNRLATGRWPRAIAAARHSPLGHNPGSDIYRTEPGFTDPRSAGAAYERIWIDRLGGYDERFDACEDVEFNHRVARADLAAYCHPDLALAYRPRRTLRALFQQMARYGRGRARLLARHPSAIPWPLIILTGLPLALLATLLAAGLAIGALAAAVLTLLYILLLAAESLRLESLTPTAVRVFLALGTIHAGLVLGFWRGLPEFGRFRTPPAAGRTGTAGTAGGTGTTGTAGGTGGKSTTGTAGEIGRK